MKNLTHANSPLAQARKVVRVELTPSRSRLSLRDQLILKRVLTGKYEYVDSPIFHRNGPDAQQTIFDDAPAIPMPDTSWYHPVMDKLTDNRQNKNVKTVLLSAKQEQVLFLQFNYCRYMVCRIRDKVSTQEAIDSRMAQDLIHWYHKADTYRDQIAQTNLALVLAMAKRTRMREVDFADLVSEGNMALLRAVDKFDVGRGFKFSTYGCRAILKAFSRTGVKLSRYRQLFPTDFDPALEKSDFLEIKRAEHESDCVDELKLIIQSNRADLSNIEAEVIEHRFGLQQPADFGEELQPLTLAQVGKIIGVTKERVRQIQNKALEKIRLRLEEDFLEL